MKQIPIVDPAVITRCRYEAGLTQSQLADVIGVHRNTIAAYEEGFFGPSPRRYAALRKAIGLDRPAAVLVRDDVA